MQLYTYCTTGWNIVVFDCMCNTQKILCYWINTTGMTHLKVFEQFHSNSDLSPFPSFRNPSCAPSQPRWKRTASTGWPIPAEMTSRRCEKAASMYHFIANSWPVTAQCWAGDFGCSRIFLQRKRSGSHKE